MPDPTPPLAALLAARIANPGHYLPRHTDSTGPYEAISRWSARAIAAGLEDGSLGYVPAAAQLHRADFDRLAAERDRWKNNFGTAQAEADRLAVELRQAHYDIARQLDTLASPGMLQMWAETCDPRPTTTEDVLRAVAEKLRRDGGPAPVPGSSRRAQEPAPASTDRQYHVEMAIRDRLFDAWPSVGGEDPEFLEQVAAEAAKSAMDAMDARLAQEPEPTDDELAAEIDSAEEAGESQASEPQPADDRTTLALQVYEDLAAANPGDMFAFDQAPGQRVAVVVAAFGRVTGPVLVGDGSGVALPPYDPDAPAGELCPSEYVQCPEGDRRCVQDVTHVATSPLHFNRAGFAWSDDEAAAAILRQRAESWATAEEDDYL